MKKSKSSFVTLDRFLKSEEKELEKENIKLGYRIPDIGGKKYLSMYYGICPLTVPKNINELNDWLNTSKLIIEEKIHPKWDVWPVYLGDYKKDNSFSPRVLSFTEQIVPSVEKKEEIAPNTELIRHFGFREVLYINNKNQKSAECKILFYPSYNIANLYHSEFRKKSEKFKQYKDFQKKMFAFLTYKYDDVVSEMNLNYCKTMFEQIEPQLLKVLHQ
jgi:hypothetical protein